MNNTNRALNRAFILIVGVIVLAIGLAAAAVNLIPFIRTGWEDTAPTVQENVDNAFATTPLLDTGNSWIGIAALALLLLLVILLIGFIFRQGHGHTNRLIRENTTASGSSIVDSAVAEETVKEALSDRPELISANVSTFDVKGTPVLNVSVTARRGVSPKDIVETVEETLRSLDKLLGTEIPAYLHISGGFRARVTSPTRLQ